MTAPGPDADCSRCGGTGWAETDNGEVARCECFLEGRRRRLMEGARIPPRYQHCSLENFEPTYPGADPGLEGAHLQCERYVEAFPDVRYGLLFTGPVGVGKTHLAVAVLRKLIRDHAIRGIFADYRDLLRSIQDSYDPVSETSEMQVLRPLLAADVLLLDELGARRPTAWVRDTVTHLLNDRYNREKVTLITTNYADASRHDSAEEEATTRQKQAPADARMTLEERIGERLRSRLHEMCKPVRMRGADFRKQVKSAGMRR